jgi:DNA-binding GntR family transcriptional regulator
MNAITLIQNLAQIESHAKEAYSTFNANASRKCAEAVAALLARHSTAPENATKLQTTLTENNLEKMLQIIEHERLASANENTRKKVMAYFRFLQSIGNLASHNNLLEKIEKVTAVQVMNCLLSWLYEDFLMTEKPAFFQKAIQEQVILPLEKVNLIL